MHQVVGFVREYNAYFSMGLLALSLVMLICTAVLFGRTSRLAKRRNAALVGASAEDLADAISDHSRLICDLQKRLNDLSSGQNMLEEAISKCLQKTSVVRFNAFEDVGGEQSFALSLLDNTNSGVVISSLYGRQDSRMYVKNIVNGEGERALSEEEQRAIGGRPRKTTVA
ncbi:MAG: DUF4446 family protein [Armatimonadota bacterium]|nr:DUF4446 family protein [bacterium]